jgi:glycosyltransferase involved in cell wall biosynthesis
MKIAIDYTAAVWQGAGIGRYTRELVRAIVAQGERFQYILFYAAGGLDRHNPYLSDLRQLCAAHPAVRAVSIPLTPRRLTQIWQRLRLPLPVELYTGPIDILHAPDFVLPPTRARTMLTIHDLSFLVHPECAEASMVRYLSRAVPRSLQRADIVLADSQATCRDLVRLLAVDPTRVTVLYPGVAARFRPMWLDQAEMVRRNLELPERFLLFVSTLEPRKNLVRLIEAFAQAIGPRTENREPGALWANREQRTKNKEQRTTDNGLRTTDNLQLVLAGRRGWLYHDIFATIARLGLGERVRVLDFVDDNDLPALYNLAEAFVYPSIYEGFGLPALEAMACGVPVLTADNSSLPEVVGDAAVLVLAEDVSSIAVGIERIVRDEALRVRLRAAGLEQAQSFTWERAAQQAVACYHRIGPRT